MLIVDDSELLYTIAFLYSTYQEANVTTVFIYVLLQDIWFVSVDEMHLSKWSHQKCIVINKHWISISLHRSQLKHQL